jgi:hypothetical protein
MVNNSLIDAMLQPAQLDVQCLLGTHTTWKGDGRCNRATNYSYNLAQPSFTHYTSKTIVDHPLATQ